MAPCAEAGVALTTLAVIAIATVPHSAHLVLFLTLPTLLGSGEARSWRRVPAPQVRVNGAAIMADYRKPLPWATDAISARQTEQDADSVCTNPDEADETFRAEHEGFQPH